MERPVPDGRIEVFSHDPYLDERASNGIQHEVFHMKDIKGWRDIEPCHNHAPKLMIQFETSRVCYPMTSVIRYYVHYNSKEYQNKLREWEQWYHNNHLSPEDVKNGKCVAIYDHDCAVCQQQEVSHEIIETLTGGKPSQPPIQSLRHLGPLG